MVKKLRFFVILGVLVMLLGACSSKKNSEFKHEETAESTSKSVVKKDLKQVAASTSSQEDTNLEGQQSSSSTVPSTDRGISEMEEKNLLADYSNEEIEYSRVWLQLMAEILSNEGYTGLETLYVDKISAGSYMDPTDKTSLQYPSDVIRLSGTRKIDGTVTYSSNGDGTITVYDFPDSWDATIKDYLSRNKISPNDYAVSVIENGHTVSIGVGDNDELKKIIEVIEFI